MCAPPHAPSPRFQNPPSSAGKPQFLDSFAQHSVHGSTSSSCSTSGAPSPMFTLTPEHINAHVPPPTSSLFKPVMVPRHKAPSHLPQRPPMPQHYATEPMQRSSQQPLATVVQQHILTPSGRAFSEGGRVQDVAADPLCPLVIFWPDNESLPEIGQIRPSSCAGIIHPPIINTGNRGPIEHQPGDWVCKKCNYLNWRRRKVCQTCFPYAEDNGDSISATIQASRIAVLKPRLDRQTAAAQTRSLAAVINKQHRRQTMDAFHPTPRHRQNYRHAAHLNSSAFNLDLSLKTSPNRQESFSPGMFHQRASRLPYGIDICRRSAPPLPYFSPAPLPLGRSLLDDAPYAPQCLPGLYSAFDATHTRAPAPASSALLPSFLNSLIQSPSLLPTSSVESSLEYEVEPSPAMSYASLDQQTYQPSPKPTALTGVPTARKSPTTNIWHVDGVEAPSRALGPIGSGHKTS